MIVVSNTSPIINLAAIGRLNLLQQLYGKVVIPQSVYDEIVVSGSGQAGSFEVSNLDWLETRSAADVALVALLQVELDSGEADAIALAVELKADLILMDERKGRKIAGRVGLRCVGLLGVLIEAKRTGLVSIVRPIVDDLIGRAGFWIGPDLYQRVLQAADE